MNDEGSAGSRRLPEAGGKSTEIKGVLSFLVRRFADGQRLHQLNAFREFHKDGAGSAGKERRTGAFLFLFLRVAGSGYFFRATFIGFAAVDEHTCRSDEQ